MNLQSKTCDDRLLMRLIQNELSGEEQAALTEHLNACPRCCRELEVQTAKARWWQEAGDALRDERDELQPLSELGLTRFEEDGEDSRHAEIERV